MPLPLTPHEKNTILMADAIGAALFAPPKRSNWDALVRLVGKREAEDFMFMGDEDGLMLYKHVNTRRYLNIDDLTGDTYKFIDAERGYLPIPIDEALAWVRG